MGTVATSGPVVTGRRSGSRHAKLRPRRFGRARTLLARAWAALGRAHADIPPRGNAW